MFRLTPQPCHPAAQLARGAVWDTGEQRLVAAAAACLLPSESPCPSISWQGYFWWPAWSSMSAPMGQRWPTPKARLDFLGCCWVWAACSIYKGLLFPLPKWLALDGDSFWYGTCWVFPVRKRRGCSGSKQGFGARLLGIFKVLPPWVWDAKQSKA